MTTVHEAWNDVMRDLREIRKDERASGGGANYNFRGIDAALLQCHLIEGNGFGIVAIAEIGVGRGGCDLAGSRLSRI